MAHIHPDDAAISKPELPSPGDGIDSTSKPTAEDGELAAKNAEMALSSANDAAEMTRNLYVTFLLLATYVTIGVATTTDELLLKNAPVKLPLLNVDVPITGFYYFVPWLILFVHFNLLLQLVLFTRKLRLFDSLADDLPLHPSKKDDTRERVYNFTFAHMLICRHESPFLRAVETLMVWLTVIALPLVLLFWLQLAFLPYHDALALQLHRLALAIDALSMILFWIHIERGNSQWLRTIWSRMGKNKYRALDGLYESPTHFPEGRARLFSIFMFASLLVFLSLSTGIEAGLEDFEDEIQPKSGLDKLLASMGDARLKVPNVVLARDPLPAAIQNKLGCEANGSSDDVMRAIVGFAFAQDRDLRSAVLSQARLPRANLNGARLANAVLKGAMLQGADMENAKLDGAELNGACLRDAKLANATLTGATLLDADLSGADLSSVTARKTTLIEAKLRGTWAVRAKFPNADLSDADLRGAVLRGASLKNAELDEADLRGTDLRSADLEGASLYKADLRGADLRGANLDNAVFKMAELQLADLRGVIGTPRLDENAPSVECISDHAAFESTCNKPASKSELEAFSLSLGKFLKTLACIETRVARGIAKRLIGESKDYTEHDKQLAVSLLAQTCTELPAEVRRELDEVAN